VTKQTINQGEVMIKRTDGKIALFVGLLLAFSSASASATKYCAYFGQEPNGDKIEGVEGVGSAPTMTMACLKARRICNTKLADAKDANLASDAATCLRYLVP
jgi:hypothetical protein